MASDAADAALAELSNKVVQLTRAVVFLHTRCDGHEARCGALRAAGEDEVKRVATWAAGFVETQKAHVVHATHWREQTLDGFEFQQAEARDEGRLAAREVQAAVQLREEMARQRAENAEQARVVAVAELRRRAERLRSELAVAEDRVRSDARWLARHLAADAARRRQRLDEEFEENSATLRAEHAEAVSELRAAREAAVCDMQVETEKRKEQVQKEAHQELVEAEALQEQSFQATHCELEATSADAREELAAAREAANTSRAEYLARQRLLDDMSRDLQAQKRRAHTLATEADQAHERRLQAETDARELRRQKAALERALSGASGTSGSGANQQERAVAGLSDDVRAAQARMESLKGQLGRTQRLLDQRRNAVAERERRAVDLRRELQEERRRSDELQRVLLRLEQDG